jgi:Flp pilus assembly protein TadD
MANPDTPARKSLFWILVFLVMVSALPFLPMFQNQFVWDDHEFIVNNPTIRSIFPLARFFKPQGRVEKGAIYPVAGTRPVTSLSFAVDYAVGKLKPFGYHLTNLILHVLCTLAAFVLLRYLTGIAAAWFGASLFAILPGHAEAVIALFGRADLLAALFVIIAFYAYLKSTAGPGPSSGIRDRSSLVWYSISVISYLFACFSKETGLVLPGLIIIYELFVAKKGVDRRELLRVTPFAVIGLLYWLFRGHALGGNAAGSHWWGGSPVNNCLMMLEVYARYIRVLFMPVVLSPLHLVNVPAGLIEWPVINGFILFIGSAVLVALALKRRMITGFFGGWFLVALIPVANIIPIPGLYMAEKWLYLPSFGFCGLAGYLLARLLSRNARAASVIFGLAAVLFSVRTFYWNRIWHDEGRLSRAILRTSPDSYLGRNMYGKDLLDHGRNREAEQEFRKVIALRPGYYLAHSNLAMALNYQNRYAEAEAEYRVTIRLNPDYAEAHSNLGVVLWLAGRNDEAVAELRSAVRMDPANSYFHYNLASILKKDGQIMEALTEYQKTAELDPKHIDAQVNIGIILGSTGRLPEAEELFRSIMSREPKNPDIRFNLALILDSEGKIEEAIEQYRAYLGLTPDSPFRPRIEERIRGLRPEK